MKLGSFASHTEIYISWHPVSDDGGDVLKNFVMNITEARSGKVCLRNIEIPATDYCFSQDGLKSNTDYKYVCSTYFEYNCDWI